MSILLLVIGIWASVSFAQEMPISAALQKYRTGIVRVGKLVENESKDAGEPQPVWLGTGFVVDQYCTFVTAKHVLASMGDGDKVVIRFQRPSDLSRVLTRTTRMLFVDPEVDLTFLRIDQVDNRRCASGSLHVFPIAKAVSPESIFGEPIAIIGHPNLVGRSFDIPVVRTGVVSSGEMKWNSHPMLLLDLLGVRGFSGSPVILQRSGEVIGVVYGPGPTPRASGFEWATPISNQDLVNALSMASNL